MTEKYRKSKVRLKFCALVAVRMAMPLKWETQKMGQAWEGLWSEFEEVERDLGKFTKHLEVQEWSLKRNSDERSRFRIHLHGSCRAGEVGEDIGHIYWL